MLKEKIVIWSGPAAAIGGILQLLPSSGWIPNISDTSQLFLGLLGFLLIAVGLVGLYLHLSGDGGRGSMVAIGLAVAGVLLVTSNMVIRLVKGPEETAAIPFLVISGMFLLIVGLALLGILTISRQVLGTLSFVPLVLAAGYVAVMISFGLVLNNPSFVIVAKIVHVLTILGWLLLGVALWQTHREPQEPGLVA